MTKEQIIHIQKVVGTTPDSFWGPKSIAACQKYLRSLMPKPNPWPGTSQAELTKFYGKPGDESKLVNLNVEGLGVKYDGKPVKTIRCHHKVADSLLRILKKLPKEILAEYAGVYNNRPMRGGSTPSLHARGAAIDLDPENNEFRDNWPLKSNMPIEVMIEFAKEGWLPAGAFWHYDSQHMQATQ